MKPEYMLDTNICIYIAKEQPPSVLEKFNSLSVGDVGMSIITYGELCYGAEKSNASKKAHEKINALSHIIKRLPMPVNAAKHYGEIRSVLEKKGTPIGNNDLWIAAHARAEDLTLVTHNVKEFKRVPNLKVVNWV